MIKILLTSLLIYINLTLFALDIPNNKRIDHWIKEYSQNKRVHFQMSLMRSGLYLKTVEGVLKIESIPIDLAWLPFIESGFDCSRKSTASAAGCWQFIRSTGNAYGLESGTWTDQRYDFYKSTVAAALYLKRLYKRFGNWELALSAYNCGPSRVIRAIKKSKNDYWHLKLPTETMNYIPKFYAVLTIIRDIEKYGFKDVQNRLVVVELRKGAHSLRHIASNVLRVDYRDFMRINPGYEIGYTAPGESTSIYLMKEWDVSLLRGFGLLSKKKAL